jgi:hypothetical protein
VTNTEMAVLLAKIQVGDNRIVDEVTIAYFQEVLDDRLTFEQANEALLRFRRERPGVYLEAGHLLEMAGETPEASPWEDLTEKLLHARMVRELAELGTTPEEYRSDPATRARVDAALDARELDTSGANGNLAGGPHGTQFD